MMIYHCQFLQVLFKYCILFIHLLNYPLISLLSLLETYEIFFKLFIIFYIHFQNLHKNKIILQLLNKSMYNRHIHQQQSNKLSSYLSSSVTTAKLKRASQKSNEKMSEKYKERIRDFLVQVTSKPLVLGQYQPPIKNIQRNPENQKIRSNAQLYINGFKTNKERIQKAVENNEILDLNPTTGTALTYDYRQRQKNLQIQPGMRFAGKTQSMIKLPSLNQQKQSKIRFKGVEEMSNNLTSMKQKEIDEIGLINRLQTVSGGRQLDHITFSYLALRESKLLKTKYKK